MRSDSIVTLVGLILVAFVLLVLAGCGRERETPPVGSSPASAPQRPLAYVGVTACAPCHETETAAWRGSFHDLAMQVASPESVLGDFSGFEVEHQGERARFHRNGDRFLVNAVGADGQASEYEVAYTFGVWPLQQVLVRTSGGRLQSFGWAWDTREREQGGQHWFHLYPDLQLAPGSPLHWSGIDQTWNHQCADCHSTDVKRGYDEEAHTYTTTWSEIDVGCEACHGPGSQHIEWDERGRPAWPRAGLTVDLSDAGGPLTWTIDPETGSARAQTARTHRPELDTCGRCHSRRGILKEGFTPGDTFADFYRLALLDPGLYQADGQILDEVFVLGSFLQSRMHGKGVTCKDCHDPHTTKPRVTGNGLCAGCHDAAHFDVPSHLRHEAGTPGSLCIECHMPQSTYMVNDDRADHSLRVPRPDLSATLGTTSACGKCHQEGETWSARAIAGWRGDAAARAPHASELLGLASRDPSGSEALLFELLRTPDVPAIVLATAMQRLAAIRPARIRLDWDAWLAHESPLVRAAAIDAALARQPQALVARARMLLMDPVRLVRIEAARAVAEASSGEVSSELRAPFDRAIVELRESLETTADRPESQLNLGNLALALGDMQEARRRFEKSMRLDPEFTPAAVNLSDTLARLGDPDGSVDVLRVALERAPDAADLHHSLGLALVRRGDREEALAHLERAARAAPEDARYALVAGIALQDAGRTLEGLGVMERALLLHPVDLDLLWALASISREAGQLDRARVHARRIAELDPGNTMARQLLDELR